MQPLMYWPRPARGEGGGTGQQRWGWWGEGGNTNGCGSLHLTLAVTAAARTLCLCMPSFCIAAIMCVGHRACRCIVCGVRGGDGADEVGPGHRASVPCRTASAWQVLSIHQVLPSCASNCCLSVMFALPLLPLLPVPLLLPAVVAQPEPAPTWCCVQQLPPCTPVVLRVLHTHTLKALACGGVGLVTAGRQGGGGGGHNTAGAPAKLSTAKLTVQAPHQCVETPARCVVGASLCPAQLAHMPPALRGPSQQRHCLQRAWCAAGATHMAVWSPTVAKHQQRRLTPHPNGIEPTCA
jgi:hypothetical protein